MCDLDQLVTGVATAWQTSTGSHAAVEALRWSTLLVLAGPVGVVDHDGWARVGRAGLRTSGKFIAHVLAYVEAHGIDPSSLEVWAALQLGD